MQGLRKAEERALNDVEKNGLCWNHRLVKDTSGEEPTWAICEVHYRGKRAIGFGEPVSLVQFFGEEDPIVGLCWVLEHAMTALDRPVLWWDGTSLRRLVDPRPATEHLE